MSEKEFVPYEATHKLRPLVLAVTIVNHGQGDAVANLLKENEAYLAFIHQGKGTAPNDFYAFSSSAIPRKDIVFGVLRIDKWAVYRSQIKERFAVSEMAKGVAFAIPIDAVSGVSIYKMLSNTRTFEAPVLPGKRKEKHHGK